MHNVWMAQTHVNFNFSFEFHSSFLLHWSFVNNLCSKVTSSWNLLYFITLSKTSFSKELSSHIGGNWCNIIQICIVWGSWWVLIKDCLINNNHVIFSSEGKWKRVWSIIRNFKKNSKLKKWLGTFWDINHIRHILSCRFTVIILHRSSQVVRTLWLCNSNMF